MLHNRLDNDLVYMYTNNYNKLTVHTKLPTVITYSCLSFLHHFVIHNIH